MNKFGNGGEESTLGDIVGCVSGQIGVPLDGFGVFGAFEGFAVDGFRVGGDFFVGMDVGLLLIGEGVGSAIGTANGWYVGAGVGMADGFKVGEGVGW